MTSFPAVAVEEYLHVVVVKLFYICDLQKKETIILAMPGSLFVCIIRTMTSLIGQATIRSRI